MNRFVDLCYEGMKIVAHANERSHWHRVIALLAALAAALFAVWLVPSQIVDPTFVRWTAGPGDGFSQFLGAHFFRYEAWHFPPGHAYNYGEQLAGSIIYSDSIPLAAFALKLLSSPLPAEVQYLGPWIVFCYAAAAWFGYRLGWVATRRVEMGLALSVLVVTNGMIAARATGHFALVAHWLILWCLLHYMQPQTTYVRRLAPLIVAPLVHAYLTVIIIAIWMADLARRVWWDKTIGVVAACKQATLALGAVALVMWLAGYFVLSASAIATTDPSMFAADLNALWNPHYIGASRFLPVWPVKGQFGESYAYLGLGVMILVVIGLVAFALRRRYPLTTSSQHEVTVSWVPLVVAALAMFCVAVSPTMYFNGALVAQLAVPDWLGSALSTFRSSGRFSWIVHYVIVLGGLVLVARYLPSRLGSVVAAACVALQLADMSPWLNTVRLSMDQSWIAQTSTLDQHLLRDPFWEKAAKHYKRIALVPQESVPPQFYRPIALMAARHGLSINSGYFSRWDEAWQLKERADVQQAFRSGRLDRDTLYVVRNHSKIEAVGTLSPFDGIGSIDNWPVVAPGWLLKETCCLKPQTTPGVLFP